MRLTLFCRHSDLVEVLQAEIAWLRSQMEHERSRAEETLNRLLTDKAIAPLPVRLPPDPAQVEMDKLLTNPEFALAGQVETA